MHLEPKESSDGLCLAIADVQFQINRLLRGIVHVSVMRRMRRMDMISIVQFLPKYDTGA